MNNTRRPPNCPWHGRLQCETVSKPAADGLALFLAAPCLHWYSAVSLDCPLSRLPAPIAPRPGSAEGRYQLRHLDEGQHPPEIVRQDRHTALRPDLLQPPHDKGAGVPPPLHRAERGCYQRLAPFHSLWAAPHPLRHRLSQLRIDPARHPPPTCSARALRLEQTAWAGRRCLRADVPPMLDGVEAARAPGARRALLRLRGSGIGASLLAAEAQLPMR